MGFPVFKALGASVGYVASHFFTFVKITWAPVALLMAVNVYVMPDILLMQETLMGIGEADDPEIVFTAMRPAMKSIGISYLAAALFLPMVFAGVLKHVIYGKTPRLPLYLQYGADELRILFGFILLLIIFGVVVTVSVVGFVALTVLFAMVASSLSPAVSGLVAVIAVLAALIAFIWYALRFSLVFPAAIATRSIGIGQSWAITRGATFGLFFFWLLLGVFVAILASPFFFLVMGDYWAPMMEMASIATTSGGADGQAAADAELRLRELDAQMLAEMKKIWTPGSSAFWINMGTVWAYTIIYYGVTAVGGGVAYRMIEERRRADEGPSRMVRRR